MNNKFYRKIECADERDLIAQVNQLKEQGTSIRSIVAPYPIEELFERQNIKNNSIGFIGFIGGFSGAVLAFLFQCWTSVKDYPIIFGGKPQFAWLSFKPVTFEIGILFAAISMFIAFAVQTKLVPGTQLFDISNEFYILISDKKKITKI